MTNLRINKVELEYTKRRNISKEVKVNTKYIFILFDTDLNMTTVHDGGGEFVRLV